MGAISEVSQDAFIRNALLEDSKRFDEQLGEINKKQQPAPIVKIEITLSWRAKSVQNSMSTNISQAEKSAVKIEELAQQKRTTHKVTDGKHYTFKFAVPKEGFDSKRIDEIKACILPYLEQSYIAYVSPNTYKYSMQLDAHGISEFGQELNSFSNSFKK